MINSKLNNNIPAACQNSNLEKRVENLESFMNGINKELTTNGVNTNILSVSNTLLSSGNTMLTSASADVFKSNKVITNELDVIDNDLNTNNLNVANNLIATNSDLGNLIFSNASGTSLNVDNAIIDNLMVNNISSGDNVTTLNDVVINGLASIQKIQLQDPTIEQIRSTNIETVNLRTPSAKIDSLVNNELDSETIKCENIVKDDTVQVNMMKSLNNTSMQLGDVENLVILGCGGRPLWNDKPLATLEDVFKDKVAPTYKGVLPNKEALETLTYPTAGDYYIITELIKGEEPNVTKGIGFALYNGESFDTDFFYELFDYRSKTDQDFIDDAQDDAIANEITRAKAIENSIISGERPVHKVADDCTMDGSKVVNEASNVFVKNNNNGISEAIKLITEKDDDITDENVRVVIKDGDNVSLSKLGNVKSYLLDGTSKNSEKLDGNTTGQVKLICFNAAHPVGDRFLTSDETADPNTIYNNDPDITSEWEYVGQGFGIYEWKRIN